LITAAYSIVFGHYIHGNLPWNTENFNVNQQSTCFNEAHMCTRMLDAWRRIDHYSWSLFLNMNNFFLYRTMANVNKTKMGQI